MTKHAGACAAVQRALLGHLDAGIRHLSLVDLDSGKAVHEARKSIKRSRAALRLLSDAGMKGLGVESTVLGNAARLLAPIRDHDVARQLEATRRGDARPVAPPPMAPLVRTFVTQSTTMLIGVRLRATGLDIAHLRSDRLLDSAERSYRVARRRWKRALDHLESEQLHHCRKSVKRTYYQVEILLGDPAPGRHGEDSLGDDRLRSLAELGELLGDHHDRFLAAEPAPPLELDALERAILTKGAIVFALTVSEHRTWIRRMLTSR